MGDQPRVLLVSPSAKPGGAERAFAALAAALPAAGVEPSVVLLKHGPLEEWLGARGCRATVAPVDGDRRAVAWVSDWARGKGISSIVSNKAHGHLVGGAAARSLGLPAVWWQHDVSRGGEVQVWAAAVPAAAI